MSLDTGTQFDETAVTTATEFAAQDQVLPNSPVLSADVNTIAERVYRRTRGMYEGGPFPSGMVITQSTVNGTGVTSTGNGSGAGVMGNGGSSGGIGVGGAGNGSAAGGSFLGGATGVGVIAQGGGGNAAGVRAIGDGSGPAVDCQTGGVQFNGTQPAKTADPGSNTAHGTSISKVWGYVTTDGAGASTIQDGLNVASVTLNVAYIRINFARAFANALYAATAGEDSGGAFTVNPRMSTSTTTYVEFIVKNATTGATIDPTANAIGITFNIMGRH